MQKYYCTFLEDVFLIFRQTTQKNIKTRIVNIKAKGAQKIANKLRTAELAVSPELTKKFPAPAVVVVEIALTVAVDELIAAAVPPPAIIAKDQVANSFISPRFTATTKIPASVAKGTLMVSRKLSTTGILSKNFYNHRYPQGNHRWYATHPFPLL